MFERKEFQVSWLRVLWEWGGEYSVWDLLGRFSRGRLREVRRRLEGELIERVLGSMNRVGWRAVMGRMDYDRCVELGLSSPVAGVELVRSSVVDRGVEWVAPEEVRRQQQVERAVRGRELRTYRELVQEQMLAPPVVTYGMNNRMSEELQAYWEQRLQDRPAHSAHMLRGALQPDIGSGSSGVVGITGVQGSTGIVGVAGVRGLGPNRNGNVYASGGPVPYEPAVRVFDYGRHDASGDKGDEGVAGVEEPKINRRMSWVAGVEPPVKEEEKKVLVQVNMDEGKLKMHCAICGAKFGKCGHTQTRSLATRPPINNDEIDYWNDRER